MVTSEIALLRTQIEEELSAMCQGLFGLAVGTSRHSFIEAKMRRVGEYQSQLEQQVRDEQATHLCYTLYVKAVESE